MLTSGCDIDKLPHSVRNEGVLDEVMGASDATRRGHTIDAANEIVEPLNDEQGDDEMIHRSGPRWCSPSVPNEAAGYAQRSAYDGTEEIRQRVEGAIVV